MKHKEILFALFLIIFTTGQSADRDAIDWKRAGELHKRFRVGETLSEEESAYLDRARAERKKSRSDRQDPGTRGDSGREQYAGGIAIPESVSPLETLEVTASDGRKMTVALRKPPGEGPFPVVVTIHGGAGQQKLSGLKKQALTNPTRTRFLAAGYVVVTSTFRSYGDEMQSRGPILDNVGVVEAVKKLPFVDPQSVVVYGGSGGGNITLELAGEVSFAAGIAGEPATIIYTGMLDKISEKNSFMTHPAEHYTEELKAQTEAKIAKIGVPLMILHGDVHPLKKINHEIVIPALQAAGKEVEVKIWPGKPHGFYWGGKMSEQDMERLMEEVSAFLVPRLKTKPVAMSLGE